MTDQDLVLSRYVEMSGEQRIYRWGDWGLSVVNGSALHVYSYAREAAVVRFKGAAPLEFELSYATPLTGDVEVFGTDEEADEFVARAREYFTGLDAANVNKVAEDHAREMKERHERHEKLMADFKARE